jgi:hypothetical protein
MKHNLELLKADINDELTRISRLRQEFEQIKVWLDKPAKDVSQYDRAAIGYYLHSFYNGCEALFTTIARFFENDLSSESWHKDLLRRMTYEINGYRPAVIDEELYGLLNDFRGFRHIFRHSYTFELDWERERLVALKFEQASSLLAEQVARFMNKLDDLE